MHRRKALGVLGTAAGLGAVGAGPVAEAAEEAHPKEDVAGTFHLSLCAFHIAKSNPSFQVEAHHYCTSLSDELHQCVIYDSRGKGAKILGVEYIVSDRIYRGLPDAEKKYYHPHTYEILSGLLIAPELKEADEDGLMKNLLTTWGKTWHTWPDPSSPLPMGDPLLMWSYSRDGQIAEKVIDERDRRMHISTPSKRERRSGLGPVPDVRPPRSLDDLGRQWTDDGPDRPKRG